MERLTDDQVLFIENYLKVSGVEYLDIRLEMTDHVASAIESGLEQGKNLDFYSVFKTYMVRNKKSLLKNDYKHRWSIDLKVLAKVKKELFKIPALLIILGITSILYNVNIVQVENSTFFTIAFAAIILIAYFIPVILYYRLKISFLNRLSVYAYLINYLFFLLLVYTDPSPGWLIVCYSSLVWVNYSIVLSAFKLSQYYKKQFSQR